MVTTAETGHDIRVQILIKAVYIFSVNIFGKGMNPAILSPAIGK